MKPWLPLITWLLVALFLPGCLRGSPPPSYYSLAPLAQPAEAEQRVHGLRFGVVLREFPEALERVQILTRDGYRVSLSEQHRWVAPPRQEFERVLVSNLGRLLGSERIAAAPWAGYFNPTNRLVVDVGQFEGPLCGEIKLRVRWVLTDGAGKVMQLQQSSILIEETDCQGYEGYVAAQSRLLARLSTEMAATLNKTAQP